MKEKTRLLGELAGLAFMILPQLPVEIGLSMVEELVLSVTVHPPAPHPMYSGITALETYVNYYPKPQGYQ